MPSGQVHYSYYKKGILPIGAISLLGAISHPYASIGLISGYIFHRYCDPDWDIMSANSAEGRMVNELPIIGHFLFGISSTYGSMFRRHHRSFITHFPFLSTAIRMGFVGLPVFFVLKSFDFDFMQNWFIIIVIFFWIGLSIADAIHYVLDVFYGD